MPLGEVIIAISNARLGIAAVECEGRLAGVITDGDIRRAMAHYRENFFSIRAEEIMTLDPKTILSDERIGAAEEMMHRNRIHSLIVVDGNGAVSGVVEFFNVS
jgi:arabinose-5-phosphate isomerase